MPSEMVTVREDVVRTPGEHDMVVITSHEAPCDADGNPAEDAFKEFDLWRANRAMSLLLMTYPGYPWQVKSDIKQGVVQISIPILMGINNWYVINERLTPIDAYQVAYAGGEILERYSLSRTRFNVGSFLAAREKHSALVVPHRKVPN